MQNKYKLPDHVRAAALAVVKSYEPFKRDIETEENECKYSFVQAVECSLSKTLESNGFTASSAVRQALIYSCVQGRKFTYSEVDGISSFTFYRMRNQLLYLIAYKLGQI